jgi:hypothetical protein
VQDADAYETVVREWASLAAMPMAQWDTKRMNALVDRMQLLQLALRDSEEGRGVIERLAIDSDPRVRGWAAVHAWKWNPALARQVIAELSEGDGPGSFEARWTLIEMDKGSLGVDWTPSQRGRSRREN